MKVKVTNKVKGEMVIACLGGSLKRNDVINLDHAKSSHQDVLWAIHHGYLEVIDSSVSTIPQGDLVCFVNCGKRTLTGKIFAKPLDPARSVVIKKDDPLYFDFMKMVEAGKLRIHQPVQAKEEKILASKEINPKPNMESKKSESKISFKKKKTNNSSSEKPSLNQDILSSKEDKSKLNAKTENRITTVKSDEPVFVDMNGEVS